MLKLSLMKLIGKEDFQKELWKQSGVELLQRFPDEVKQNYQFIFALNDWQTLLKLDNELVQEHIQFIQSCLIESMIQLSLNEIMQPLQYLTMTKVKGQIEIESQCKLGVLHRITEINNSDLWELSRWNKSKPDSSEETVQFKSIDEIIDCIVEIEMTWRKKRSIFISD